MDWLVGVALLVAGGVLGFVIAKLLGDKQTNASEDINSEQTVKELMAQQASNHLHQTKNITAEINQHLAQLNEQISQYEQLIISQKSGQEGEQLNYFGDDATAYLRNKSSRETKQTSTADVQPLDFSAESSGLFSGNQDTEKKSN